MELITEFTELKLADTDHPILSFLARRWSPRVFSDESVKREDVKVLLEAARWAASSFNQQPWRFIYTFKGSRGYEKIFNCLTASNQQWARNASVLMLTAFQNNFDNGKENFHALHDLGLAVGNLTLQAQSMGIAIHQMAGIDREKAAKVFNVPDEFTVATAIAIGHYGGDPSDLPEKLESKETSSRSRKPLGEIAYEGKWRE